MKKIIRMVTADPKIVQITIADERWYAKDITDEVTGLPSFKFVPSVTWIASFYPKGIAFWKWLADKGWDESQALKQAAGNKGSKVHQAVEALFHGREVSMDSKFLNKDKGEEEELTIEEWECIVSFTQWYGTLPVGTKLISSERVVFNDKYGFAGTVDVVLDIEGQIWVIDFKTGQEIWPEYELQLSAYKKALNIPDAKLAVLQLGYRRNKNRYKFTEIEDQFDLFLAARSIWQKETSGVEPVKREYPLSVRIEYKSEGEETKPVIRKPKKTK